MPVGAPFPESIGRFAEESGVESGEPVKTGPQSGCIEPPGAMREASRVEVLEEQPTLVAMKAMTEEGGHTCLSGEERYVAFIEGGSTV